MRTRLALLLSLLVAGPSAAQKAAPPPAPASKASIEYAVEESGGGYEVTVSPTFVTVFYLPEKVRRAIASNQKDFSITLLQDTVVVKPRSDKIGLTANLSIETRKTRIGVILKIGEAKDAVPQVIFTHAKEKAAIDRKVEEALAPRRAELDERERNLAAHIRAAAETAIAEGMAKDFVVQEIDLVARNDANVIARVPRAIRIGDAVYVQFSVQNRSGAPYLLRQVVLVQDKRELAGRFTFLPRQGALGKVDAHGRGRGVVVVPAADLRAGRPFDLRLIEEPSGAAIAVGGLRAP